MAYTVQVDESKCIGCKICARICPTGTLQVNPEIRKAYTTDITCDNAWGCLYACPTEALSIIEAKA